MPKDGRDERGVGVDEDGDPVCKTLEDGEPNLRRLEKRLLRGRRGVFHLVNFRGSSFGRGICVAMAERGHSKHDFETQGWNGLDKDRNRIE